MTTHDTRYLRALSYRIPDAESALVEIAHLSRVLTLPRVPRCSCATALGGQS